MPAFSYIFLSSTFPPPITFHKSSGATLKALLTSSLLPPNPHFVYMVCASPSTVQFPSVSRKAVKYFPKTLLRKDRFCFIIIILFLRVVPRTILCDSWIHRSSSSSPPPPMVVVKTMCLGLFGMPPWNGRLPTVATEQNL